MSVPNFSVPLPTFRDPLTSAQVGEHGPLLHTTELLAALFRHTFAGALSMTRNNMAEWLDWHIRLEGLMVRVRCLGVISPLRLTSFLRVGCLSYL